MFLAILRSRFILIAAKSENIGPDLVVVADFLRIRPRLWGSLHCPRNTNNAESTQAHTGARDDIQPPSPYWNNKYKRSTSGRSRLDLFACLRHVSCCVRLAGVLCRSPALEISSTSEPKGKLSLPEAKIFLADWKYIERIVASIFVCGAGAVANRPPSFSRAKVCFVCCASACACACAKNVPAKV